MNILHLHVKEKYFNKIKKGFKKEEYRRQTKYWTIRIVDKEYDQIIIYCGYPHNLYAGTKLIFPWRGYTVKTIIHPEFGDQPTAVFAIPLEGAIQCD